MNFNFVETMYLFIYDVKVNYTLDVNKIMCWLLSLIAPTLTRLRWQL